LTADDHETLARVVTAFIDADATADAAPLGRGHIHDSFLVHLGSGARIVLQRLNDRVFPDPVAVMQNVARVTEHLRARLIERGDPEPDRHCLRLLPTRDGATHHTDEEGLVWRAYPFIERSRSLAAAEVPEQAQEAARAFGAFVRDLADLPPDSLHETIPRFHHLDSRLAALEDAAARDPLRRASAVGAELAAARAAHARIVDQLGAMPPLPRRVVHNDCKLDNVLFDADRDVALCVVDLDTVMPGNVLCDFGDLARTACSRAVEDERDLARVTFELDRFAALVRGYRRGAGSMLEPVEIAALPLAGPLLTLETGVRFLTDHLEGDTYFRVAREAHNLDRARVQLALLERMHAARDGMRRAVEG
jgi:Ser/Thr protein kinase RdoA (MazF antagonist)